MKQYGDKKPIFTSGCDFLLTDTHIRLETYFAGSYSKLFRDGRRSINKDPVKWWRQQTSNDGLPHLYHCWGW